MTDDTAALIERAQQALAAGVDPRVLPLITDLAAALSRAQADADRRLKSALAAAWPTWVRELLAAADDLSFHAQTSGGVAGRDEALVTAIDRYAKAREVAEEKYSALARAALVSEKTQGGERDAPDHPSV